MTLKYVALIRKEETTDFWVDILDLPGCVSCGESIEEAKASFEEALEFYLEDIRDDEQVTLPKPRSCEEVLSVKIST